MKTQFPSTEVLSCAEIEIHYKRPLFSEMKKINHSRDVNELFKEFIDPNVLDVKEFFWVMFLSRANRVLGIATVGCGDVTGVMVNSKEIFQLTLLSHASHIIVAHNHPSGKLTPSQKDKNITRKIQRGVALFDAKLLDHLILTSESYYSFSDEGIL
jgi:DNA repair protein RadC